MAQKRMTFEKQITKTLYLDYFLYLPKDYDSSSNRKWPMILFLHGAGERGDGLEAVKKHGIPKIVAEDDEFPFIVVSPQCPENTLWKDHFEALDALLKEIGAAYSVDSDRVYLTGLSMEDMVRGTLRPSIRIVLLPWCPYAAAAYLSTVSRRE